MHRSLAMVLFLTPALAGKTVASTDKDGKPWTQVFQNDGLSIYSQGTAVSSGNWRVTADQYCSHWPPDHSWTCYGMTGEGDHAAFVSSSGAGQCMVSQARASRWASAIWAAVISREISRRYSFAASLPFSAARLNHLCAAI